MDNNNDLPTTATTQDVAADVAAKSLTARERGYLEGRREALRDCATDLRAALKKSDPEFRVFAIDAALNWFHEATR